MFNESKLKRVLKVALADGDSNCASGWNWQDMDCAKEERVICEGGVPVGTV